VQFGRDLAAAVTQVPDYNPTAANLNAAMKVLADKNDNVASQSGRRSNEFGRVKGISGIEDCRDSKTDPGCPR